MLAKRIIPCLDVKNGVVVKGVQFRNHEVMGGIVELAKRYADEGADELVFYDITASSDARVVDKSWVRKIAEVINIPFCVAGGIRSVEDAARCGIDSYYDAATDRYLVKQYTGDESRTLITKWTTPEWVEKVQECGCGEIVLNMMNQDGMRKGYDLKQLKLIRSIAKVPLIASGGAGEMSHFRDGFKDADCDGCLAASVFHKGLIHIPELKDYLRKEGVTVRD